MAQKKTKQTAIDISCLNCERPFTGVEKFCPECGQKNKGKTLKLKDFIREIFAGFLSWDAKFWRTIIPLLIKPGSVSKDYIEGKRVRFTNPFRFFFIVSIIFFFLIKITSKYEEEFEFGDDNTNDSISIPEATIFNKDIGSFIKYQKEHPRIKTESALDSLNEENTFTNRLFYKKAKTINEFSNDKKGSLVKLIKLSLSYLSSASLFLLPVFALFLKLLYIRRKQNYMNHLIFVFHIATFFFICLIFLELSRLIPGIKTFIENSVFYTIAPIIVFTVYPFLAMKRFYGQSIIKTFFKLVITGTIFSILITIAVVLNFILAFMMM